MSAEEEKDVAADEAAEAPKEAKKRTRKAPAAKKAAQEKAVAAEGGEAAAEKPAAKKPRARKAAKQPAAAEAKSEPKEGENAPEKQRRRKKAAAPTPAAPGSGEEAKEAAKAKPQPATPARRVAAGAKGTSRRRVVRAHARYVRTSARKARMVCGHLRGKSIAEARAILAFTPREVARDWSKLLESAVANAESNHELLQDDLIVREAYADEGPTIKRFRPRAMGRATPIRKRTSHLTITLTARPEGATPKRKG
jgi:ribosomal protein L22